MANNLYEYYTGQGKALPSVADRQGIATSAGIQNYTGDANQNATLLNYLQKPASTLPVANGATNGTVKTPVTIDTPAGTYQSPETIAAQNAQANYLNTLTASAPDESKIRQQKLDEMQAAIDATNNLYANKLAEAKVQGAGRLGTTTAVGARRGLLGSDFGNAQYDTQVQGNEDTYKSIENERLTKVNALLTQAKTDATTEIANKRAEFAKGLDSRLAYYQSADQRKVDNTNKAISAIIAKGLDPNSIDPTSLTQYAKYYEISPEDIKASYATEKASYEQAQAKLAQDATKALPTSAQEYEYAKNNGYKGTFSQYQNEDANRKAKAAGTGGSGGTVASKQGTDVLNILSVFRNKMTQNNWKGINPDDYNFFRNQLLETYGGAGVNLLDSEIEKAGLLIDN